MKLFISYRCSGEDWTDLRARLTRICASLEEAGHQPFCYFLKGDPNLPNKTIFELAIKELDDSDCLLACVLGNEKSEGMLLEIGHALAKKKKFILAIKKGIPTNFLHLLADEVIEFEGLDELYEELSTLPKEI